MQTIFKICTLTGLLFLTSISYSDPTVVDVDQIATSSTPLHTYLGYQNANYAQPKLVEWRLSQYLAQAPEDSWHVIPYSERGLFPILARLKMTEVFSNHGKFVVVGSQAQLNNLRKQDFIVDYALLTDETQTARELLTTLILAKGKDSRRSFKTLRYSERSEESRKDPSALPQDDGSVIALSRSNIVLFEGGQFAFDTLLETVSRSSFALDAKRSQINISAEMNFNPANLSHSSGRFAVSEILSERSLFEKISESISLEAYYHDETYQGTSAPTSNVDDSLVEFAQIRGDETHIRKKLQDLKTGVHGSLLEDQAVFPDGSQWLAFLRGNRLQLRYIASQKPVKYRYKFEVNGRSVALKVRQKPNPSSADQLFYLPLENNDSLTIKIRAKSTGRMGAADAYGTLLIQKFNPTILANMSATRERLFSVQLDAAKNALRQIDNGELAGFNFVPSREDLVQRIELLTEVRMGQLTQNLRSLSEQLNLVDLSPCATLFDSR